MNQYEPNCIPISLNGILSVDPDSIADDLNITSGDRLISINGEKIHDVIDYRYHMSSEYILMLIEKEDGSLIEFEIDKDPYMDLGLNFNSPLMDNQKTCSNKCDFCFVDQMPRGMRETLYIKDDDSRLSFLQGNYITLTNLTKDDMERIVDYKLSPINISVHTTDPTIRVKMLKNPRAGKILEQISYLAKHNIMMNCQIVALPGINDGRVLQSTLEDLSQFYPNISSVAVVPVGLTRYREGLTNIVPFTKTAARDLIDIVENYGNRQILKNGFRWVYPSDEFYLLAEQEIPKEEFYDEYPQYENGVGLIRSFYEEAMGELINVSEHHERGEITIATGEYAQPFLQNIVYQIEKKLPNVKIKVISIQNNFFGSPIKVAGLLTGEDIVKQLKGKSTGVIMLPKVLFRKDQMITLDDYTIGELEKILEAKVYAVENDGASFIKLIEEVSFFG